MMDRAYEGDETLQLARQLGYVPVVPSNPNRLEPWEYDRAAYRRRNEIERLFRRLKAYRRIFAASTTRRPLHWFHRLCSHYRSFEK